MPRPPVHSPPGSGAYVLLARKVSTKRWSLGSVGELTRSWKPHDEITIGEERPG